MQLKETNRLQTEYGLNLLQFLRAPANPKLEFKSSETVTRDNFTAFLIRSFAKSRGQNMRMRIYLD